LDLRLRELRFLPPFFALRLADRLADFLLPPFLAEAFLREERLLGAMVPKTGDYEFETNLRTAQPGGTKHTKSFKMESRIRYHHLANCYGNNTSDSSRPPDNQRK
jgi:hypothetical protein